jgi:uncharacterized protein
METRRHFAEKFPYVFSVLLVAAIAVIQTLAFAIFKLLNIEDIRYAYLGSDVILAAIGTAVISSKRWWRAIGFRRPIKLRHFLFFLVPLIPVMQNLSAGFNVNVLYDILLFLVLTLVVGFFEESYFRGLMLRPLALLGKWRAAIVTAVIFGLAHSLNIVSGFNSQVVFTQMAYASAIGFTYAAVALRTGMVWPLMIIHFLTNFTGFMAMGGELMQAQNSWFSLIMTAVYVVVFTGYGLIVLWRAKPVL